MDEEAKKILDDIKEELKNGITKEVFEKVKNELPLRKDIFGGDKDTKTEDLDDKKRASEFVKAIKNKDGARAKALTEVERKAMSEGTDADGGFIVPEYFSNEIIRVANDYGVVRRLARHWPMKSLTQHVPSASGVTAYRISENTKATSSKATLSEVVLTAQKLAALIPISNELLEDADPDLVNLLTILAAEALAGKEDEWGLKGLAATEGIFQGSDVTGVTMGSTKDAFTDATADDLLDMQNELKSKAVGGARYVMHHTVLNIFRKLKSTLSGDYIVQQPAGSGITTLWTLPVELSDALPAASDSAASTKFVALSNFNYMLFGDRKQITMSISDEATVTDTDGTTALNLFEQDMSAVKFVERIDIKLAEQANAYAWLKTAAS